VYAAQYETLRAHMMAIAGAASRGVGRALDDSKDSLPGLVPCGLAWGRLAHGSRPDSADRPVPSIATRPMPWRDRFPPMCCHRPSTPKSPVFSPRSSCHVRGGESRTPITEDPTMLTDAHQKVTARHLSRDA